MRRLDCSAHAGLPRGDKRNRGRGSTDFLKAGSVRSPVLGKSLLPKGKIRGHGTGRGKSTQITPPVSLANSKRILASALRLFNAVRCRLVGWRGKVAPEDSYARREDTRPNESGPFSGRAACAVIPVALQERGTFAGCGIFPCLGHFYRRAIRRAKRVAMQPASEYGIADEWSAIRKVSGSTDSAGASHGKPPTGRYALGNLGENFRRPLSAQKRPGWSLAFPL